MNSYLELFSGTYEQKVTQLFQTFRKHESVREEEQHYDFTSSCVQRRIAATTTYRHTAQKELAGIASPAEISDIFAFCNGMILRGGYTTQDIAMAVVFSSAIWILDQLNVQGQISEIYPFLPDTCEEDEFPIGIHPQYDRELMCAVAKLIYFRNEEKYSVVDWTLPTLISAKKKTQPRRAYDAVIALLDSGAVKSAQRQYEKKVWDYYRLVLGANRKLQLEIESIDRKIENLREKLLKSSPFSLMAIRGGFDQNNPVIKEIEALNHKRERFENTGLLTELGLVDSREKTVRRFKDIIGEELAEQVIKFKVEDPFEGAFALHTLLDEGSLLPWLYYGSICVTYTMVDQMPFYSNFVVKGDKKLLKEANNTLYMPKYEGLRWKDITDCRGEPVERMCGKNLGQILYLNSHTLYPRVAPEMPQLNGYFDDLGVMDESERRAYMLLIHLLNATHTDTESLQAYRLNKELEKSSDIEEVSQSADTATLEYTVSSLQGKIDILKRLLHEEERLRKNTLAENGELKKEKARLLRELADLREIVFLQREEAPAPAPPKSEIHFPLMTSGKIVSFGGHPNWIKEMKGMLPNVLFYSPDVIPNRDVIRNADQVWVQTQYISHAAFYRIESSLGVNTQLRFFPNQNARSCAEKLAIENGVKG